MIANPDHLLVLVAVSSMIIAAICIAKKKSVLTLIFIDALFLLASVFSSNLGVPDMVGIAAYIIFFSACVYLFCLSRYGNPGAEVIIFPTYSLSLTTFFILISPILFLAFYHYYIVGVELNEFQRFDRLKSGLMGLPSRAATLGMQYILAGCIYGVCFAKNGVSRNGYLCLTFVSMALLLITGNKSSVIPNLFMLMVGFDKLRFSSGRGWLHRKFNQNLARYKSWLFIIGVSLIASLSYIVSKFAGNVDMEVYALLTRRVLDYHGVGLIGIYLDPSAAAAAIGQNPMLHDFGHLTRKVIGSAGNSEISSVILAHTFNPGVLGKIAPLTPSLIGYYLMSVGYWLTPLLLVGTAYLVSVLYRNTLMADCQTKFMLYSFLLYNLLVLITRGDVVYMTWNVAISSAVFFIWYVVWSVMRKI